MGTGKTGLDPTRFDQKQLGERWLSETGKCQTGLYEYNSLKNWLYWMKSVI